MKRNAGNQRNDKKGNKRKPYNKKGKMFEINVKDSSVNKEDFMGPRSSQEDNDEAWYNHFPELVKGVATPSFSDPLGTYLSSIEFKGRFQPTGIDIRTLSSGVPGICVIDYSPTIGLASGLTVDYINVSLNRLFVFLRRNLSTTSSYDAADLGYYLESLDSIYQIYQTCVRAYGFAQNAKVYNRYSQKALVEAMGFNSDWMMANLNQFRTQLNYIAHTLAQFCVPSELDFINRHVWMCSEVFCDNDAVKSQWYFYRLNGYYKLIEATGSAKPAYLQYNEINAYSPNNTRDGDWWLTLLTDCINAIMNSTDMIQISGDLLKGFGGDSMFGVQPISENYIIEPYFSREVLSQIENTILMGDPATAGEVWDITQSTDLAGGPNLIQKVTTTLSTTGAPNLAATFEAIGDNPYVLNMHMDDPTPGNVMVATRLMVPFSLDNQTDVSADIVPWALGTEIAHRMTFYGYRTPQIPGANAATQLLTYSPTELYKCITNAGFSEQVSMLWSIFDWAPRVYLVSNGEQSSDVLLYMLMDIDNYAVVDGDFLNATHRVAVTSEYDIPRIQTLASKPVNK